MSVPVALPQGAGGGSSTAAPPPSAPCGVQVVARVGEDARLLAVARVLEQALGGFDHEPPGWD
jgi:Asp-tRNA(Asn)/Glu-tRNA(Gln) amidotransferase A subunit family amidase